MVTFGRRVVVLQDDEGERATLALGTLGTLTVLGLGTLLVMSLLDKKKRRR